MFVWGYRQCVQALLDIVKRKKLNAEQSGLNSYANIFKRLSKVYVNKKIKSAKKAICDHLLQRLFGSGKK